MDMLEVATHTVPRWYIPTLEGYMAPLAPPLKCCASGTPVVQLAPPSSYSKKYSLQQVLDTRRVSTSLLRTVISVSPRARVELPRAARGTINFRSKRLRSYRVLNPKFGQSRDLQMAGDVNVLPMAGVSTPYVDGGAPMTGASISDADDCHIEVGGFHF